MSLDLREKNLEALRGVALSSVDAQAEAAFEEIRTKGFEVFAVFGHSPMTRMAAGISTSEPGSYEQVTGEKDAMNVYLFANDPELDYQSLISSNLRHEVMGLVPQKVNGIKVDYKAVYSYEGGLSSSKGSI